jgi:hypothetical protein
VVDSSAVRTFNGHASASSLALSLDGRYLVSAGQNDIYAVLQCDDERTGLFSMIVLPWLKPLPILVEPYHGPNWQALVPSDSPDPDADAELLRLIYEPHARPAAHKGRY